MSRELRAGAVAGAGVVVLLAGCALFDRSEPEVAATPLSAAVAEGAAVACGMDEASVETALGVRVSAPTGALDGKRCVLKAEGSERTVISVRVLAAASPEQAWKRAALVGDGPAQGGRAPDVRFAEVLGGAWLDWSPIRGGAVDVFAGDRSVQVVSRISPSQRDVADDLLSLAEQVARTQGLDVERLPGRPAR